MRCIAGAVMAVVGAVDAASGQVIDFETLPDGVTAPTDDAPLGLDDSYVVDSVHVLFGWDTDGDGVTDLPANFEAQGGGPPGAETSGFFLCGPDAGGLPAADTAAAGFEDLLGSWMLRRPQPFRLDWKFVISYSEPVLAVTGQIWDIDHAPAGVYERWRIEARLGDTLQTVLTTPPVDQLPVGPCESFDGEPFVFSFAVAGGFDTITVSFIGTQPDPGFVFDGFSATSSIPGPTLLTHEPAHRASDPAGIAEAHLYWSEPVTIAASDVGVLTNDATGQPVPFTVAGSGTQITTITFTGRPGGPDTGGPVPLQLGSYAVTVRDTARASANNAPIDGDNDGVSGGDATVLIRHTCAADLAVPFGQLTFGDVSAFLAVFNSGCTAP